MSKPKKHVEEIRNLAFASETLKIKKNDVVEYFVARHHQSKYNSLYKEVNRFFILQIEEADVESPSLYQNQSFSYRFREAGLYTVSCLNYPKMRQSVVVEDRESHSMTDFKSSEATSQISCTAKGSLFMQSENHIADVLDQSLDQEFNEISECLHLIKEGCPAFSIKSKFNDLFDNNQQSSSTNVLKNLNTSSQVSHLNDDCKSPQHSNCHNDSEQDDLFRVHQLNKMSPNNLFVLLKRLKQQYVKEDEKKVALSFKTFDDLALYCKQTYKRPAPASNFDNKAVINRALNNITRRFN